MHRALYPGVVAGLLTLTSCGQNRSPQPATAVHLIDLYRPEMVRGTLAAQPLPRMQWRFDGQESAPAPERFPATRGWEAGPGVGNLTIRDGRLCGRSTADFPGRSA